MRHYCTLFDKNYLAKGLAMYESLKRHSSEEFRFWVLAMDRTTCEVMTAETSSRRVNVYSVADLFSDLREGRTWQEFCWTCASNFAERLLGQQVPEITYLDADLFFFSDPKPVHEEIGARSIGIIPHRLIPEKRHLEVNGKFNVGWVTFKNTEVGRACLSRWAAQVRERCDASTCGDQKFLDEWPDLYGDQVCIIQNIGANVAPWNVGNYLLIQKDELYVSVDGCASEREVIFYHFHEFGENEDGTLQLSNYELRNCDKQFIYAPYIKAYLRAKERIASLHLQAAGHR